MSTFNLSVFGFLPVQDGDEIKAVYATANRGQALLVDNRSRKYAVVPVASLLKGKLPSRWKTLDLTVKSVAPFRDHFILWTENGVCFELQSNKARRRAKLPLPNSDTFSFIPPLNHGSRWASRRLRALNEHSIFSMKLPSAISNRVAFVYNPPGEGGSRVVIDCSGHLEFFRTEPIEAMDRLSSFLASPNRIVSFHDGQIDVFWLHPM